MQQAWRGMHPGTGWDNQARTDATDPTGHRRRMAGKHLCGAKFVALLSMLGADLDYPCNYLRLRHFNTVDACFCCSAQAADTELAMTNVKDDAPWRATVESDASFKAQNQTTFGNSAMCSGQCVVVHVSAI